MHQVSREIAEIGQAYWIPKGDDRGLDSVAEGKAEWEIEAGAHDHAPARRRGNVLPDLGLLRAEQPAEPVPLHQPAIKRASWCS